MQGSVVIVNYNGGEKILNCIAAVKRNFSGCYEIIVVDNASSDDSCSNIENLYPDVKVLYMGRNSGFGTACNFGAKNTSSEYFLFLNPDAYVENDCLSLMRKQMDADDKLGFVGGVLKDLDGNVCQSSGYFPSLMSCFYDCIGFKGNKCSEGGMQFVSGALLLARRSVFDRLNGFDEDFFMYFEETDLQYRAARLGYSVCVAKDASAIHEVGGMCANPMSRLKRYLHGMRIYFNKRNGPFGFAVAYIISILYLVSRWALYRYRRF